MGGSQLFVRQTPTYVVDVQLKFRLVGCCDFVLTHRRKQLGMKVAAAGANV